MNLHDLNVPALVHIAALAALFIMMVWVIISDLVLYIIPNNLNLGILILFIGCIFFLPISPLMALAAAGLVLLVGLVFFSVGFMGGGDVKLLVVLTLWTGWDIATVNFLVMTTIMGGVLVIFTLIARFFAQPLIFKANPMRKVPRFLTKGQPVPYGIAIAMAFLVMMWMGTIPSLH